MPQSLDEDGLIARYFAPIAGPGALGLSDDAALLTPPAGAQLVLTKDALVAGVHFFADDPPDAIARKALRVNISDLAAKGADPIGFMLAIALPAACDETWVSGFAQGLGADARGFGIALLGGDTVRTPGPAMVSITAIGSVPVGAMVPRTGVHDGDILYVTGTIGDAALGLRLRGGETVAGLSPAARDTLIERYLEPQPRLALRRALRTYAHAGMDVSDGLIGDITKMLRVSGVTARIALARIPLSSAARQAVTLHPDLFEVAVTGGDDYEIIAAVSQENSAPFEAAAQEAGIAVTRLGTATTGTKKPVFHTASGAVRRFAHPSFSHI